MLFMVTTAEWGSSIVFCPPKDFRWLPRRRLSFASLRCQNCQNDDDTHVAFVHQCWVDVKPNKSKRRPSSFHVDDFQTTPYKV